MKVKFIKNTVANRTQVRPGDVLELDPKEAVHLLRSGRCVEVEESTASTTPAQSAALAETAEKDPVKKRKSKKQKEFEL